MTDMTGKTVLITGASRGIGAAAARRFAQAGANVALLARTEEAIADLAGEIGDKALAIPCDISRYWEVDAAVNGTILTISSGAAHSPIEAWSAYCASKAGAAMLTRATDHETRAQGIRAIGLSPGTVATDMQREIKSSGINPVSQLEWTDHIPPEWPAETLLWLSGPAGDDWLGQEVSLRDENVRRAVGLID